MVTLFAVAYGIVLHLGAGRVLIRKSATRAVETLLPESFRFGTSFRRAETNWIEFFTLAETSDRVAEHVLQFRIARDIARRAQLLPLRSDVVLIVFVDVVVVVVGYAHVIICR